MTDFELPITYCSETKNLDSHIINDLEFDKSSDLFKAIFKPKTSFGEKNLSLWGKYYTTNKQYLKETQILLKKDISNIDKINTANIEAVWKKITLGDDSSGDEIGFYDKYNYVEWELFRNFNNNATFLQVMSMYSLVSPIISLALPILFLIFPFFIIRLRGFKITMNNYISILKTVLKSHQIGQIFTISSASWNKRIYILISLGFYILQIYQNVRLCISFCKNMKTIHKDLFDIRDHIDNSIKLMNNFKSVSKELGTYNKFNDNMDIHLKQLNTIHMQLESITPLNISLKKLNHIGHIRKCFYQINKNNNLKSALQYSFDFCGYIDNLQGIKAAIKNKSLGLCKFVKKQTKFKNAYFPITDKKPVKNTYNLNKHMLITGPNAAGKTTILKTTLFNIIISQQIGYGCYKSATLVPFDYIHCYINIPDTSDRDSLFQAEARRCKDIISLIERNDTYRHFCVFDELYSGTNPYEAIGSAAAYLKYLNKFPNVCFVLTTHFLDLCKRFDNNKKIVNYHMDISGSELDFKYTYLLKTGISNVKGGVKVLNDLEYPYEIIEETQKIIKELII
tara:strand:+ start:30223 stop:31920 length:1698 start_codon:yes stop_codon:yes gene_type:complete